MTFVDWSAKAITAITEATPPTASIIDGVADVVECETVSKNDGEEVGQTAKLANSVRISSFQQSPLQVNVHLSLIT